MKLICLEFLALSTWALVREMPHLVAQIRAPEEPGTFSVHGTFIVGFLLAVGLWRYWLWARRLVIVLTGFWLLAGLFQILVAFSLANAKMSGGLLDGIPEEWLRIIVIPFCLVMVWQFWVLLRADIFKLYGGWQPEDPAET